MNIVYVLESEKDGKFYIGCTKNIEERLKAHNNGRVTSTKYRRPLKLIYTENFSDIYTAYKMERFYKTAVGKRELKKKIDK